VTATARSHAELVTLRKSAAELAQARRERLSSIHLLASIAASHGPAGDLLRERRLDPDTLLKASRSFDDEGEEPIHRLLQAARETKAHGQSMQPRGPGLDTAPTALHLLLAVLGDRRTAAHRALVASGVDLARLRARGMQLALGMISVRPSRPLPPSPEALEAPPRPSKKREADGSRPSPALGPPSPPAPSRGRGHDGPAVVVPLFPPPMAREPRRSPRSQEPPPEAAPPPSMLAPTPDGRHEARFDARFDRFDARHTDELTGPSSTSLPAQAPTHGPTHGPLAPTAHPGHAPHGQPHAPGHTGQGGHAGHAAPSHHYDPPPIRFPELDPARYPALGAVGENLTQSAAEGRLSSVVVRDAELERAATVLARKSARSPLLIGPAGVGKTALLRGLARALFHAEEGEAERSIVIEVVPSELLADVGSRSALVERIQELRREACELAGRVILAVDDAHELFAIEEAALELRLAMTRGELAVAAATTPEDFKKTFEPSHGLVRCFTTVPVDEPSEDEAITLVAAVEPELAKHHGVPFTRDALAEAVRWTVRYVPGRALPDKAITVLDLAGARARRARAPTVGAEHVAEIISDLADVPVARLLETDGARMLRLEEELGRRVVGHRAQLTTIARVLRRNAAGLRAGRPIGSFLLLGPTGVGKTETAKAVAEALFQSESAMTRLDLSEYAEPHSIARLLGAPPGYVGFEAGGQLTEAVRRRPYQVVLLDEIEKAHRDVLEAFLQVLDEGHMTDGRGRKVDFTSTVLLLTSNLGAAEAMAQKSVRRVGFAGDDAPKPGRKANDVMLGAARSELTPELYNRIDEVLVFEPLGRGDVAEVAERLLGRLVTSMAERGIELELSPEVPLALLDLGGFEPELGARPMKRTIGRFVETPLAELLLAGTLGEGDVARVSVERGVIVVAPVRGRAAKAARGRG
jgi:ATP-dependent Clp protease ATP-binding subunit ClpC